MRRGIRILLILVVVVVGLLVAADRIALSVAESKAADRIQSAEGLSAKPGVSVKGFPFLTQVLAKNLDEVTVSATDLHPNGTTVEGATGPLTIARFDADLRDVRINSDFSSAVADTASGTALVSYADLTKAAPSGVSVSYGGTDSSGKGRVKVTGSITLPVLGQTLHRSVLSEISLDGGNAVRLRAQEIPGGDAVPGLDQLVRSKTDFTRRLSGLPHGIQLSSIRATLQGVEITLTGKNVSLTG
ncbi:MULTISPECIES: LmeA family phospholipid-binding protein [Streptomycetaceae]|uniref:DUF2993 domain-containing protein n=1 Tax=Streptantibioticus cattleyicolor (strain ATCC 35852 / DSM 46488 / JCM 4925 / NBRC 14057 / NRRL 8057) TaxID=1003195 RepID=F8K140_STREN|nr:MULTISPECIES: DUF2993 domain-containing protein [Streptomycetaceae]AEW94909.1 hypothetical protein SCATT_25380 [Streptantibioticus cattleyicolor NRRL 8057 = DSM 46488]MYS59518.1 LmeA family phospholipid-binding protein [Streptomyces sp. SID5468]CCB75260.1 Secreted protein [Streptantibioticus cattleyicolor NRRL 8057 = DSM 46488]